MSSPTPLDTLAPDPEILEVLRAECQGVSAAVLGLSEEAFSRPTRCAAWNVKELLGHIYRGVERIAVYTASEPGDAATHDAVSYFRAYDRAPGSADSEGVADRAKEVAEGYETGAALAEAWDHLWPATLDQAAAGDPDRVVVTFGPAITLGEYLKTRVLELTAHGLDLAAALDREPWATPEGLTVTRGILAALMTREPPEELGWDDRAFAEKGLGRVPLGDEERSVLGEFADAFPLVG